MKVLLYVAISVDGFVAKNDGDSEWVSLKDWPNVEAVISQAGCVVVGGRTYRQYEEEMFPLMKVLNVVVARDTGGIEQDDRVVVVGSPREAVKVATDKGLKEMVVIGGGTTNGLFLRAGLVDEVVVAVHPLVLGEGIKLFGQGEVGAKLELVSVDQTEEGLVKIRYKVDKE